MAHLTPRQQFIQDHGGNEVMVHSPEDHMVYFPDGAWMEPASYGVLCVPDREYERACNVLRYWAIKMNYATEKFTELRRQLRSQVQAYEKTGFGRVDQEDIDALKPLQAEVLRCKREVGKARKAVEQHRPAVNRPRGGDPAEVQRALEALDSIKV